MKITNENIEAMLLNETKDITPDNFQVIRQKTIDLKNEKELMYKRNFARPLRFALCALLIVFIGLGGLFYYNNLVEIIALDCNPSIEFYINRFDIVIDIDYINDDAEEVYKELDLENKKIDEVLKLCYGELQKEGYLNKEENLVVISGYCLNGEFNDEKLDKLIGIIEEENIKGNINCIVEKNNVTKEMKQLADENDISLGKLKIVNTIIEMSEEFTFDELKDISMNGLKEIYHDLNEPVEPTPDVPVGPTVPEQPTPEDPVEPTEPVVPTPEDPLDLIKVQIILIEAKIKLIQEQLEMENVENREELEETLALLQNDLQELLKIIDSRK